MHIIWITVAVAIMISAGVCLCLLVSVIGCVVYIRSRQKKHPDKVEIHGFEMTQNPIYDHQIQTFNNCAYGQITFTRERKNCAND